MAKFNSRHATLLNEIRMTGVFMAKEKDKKEIVVPPPPKSVTPREKRAERAAQKALEKERFGVLQISHKVGTYFSASMLVAGALLLCIPTYVIVTGYIDWIVISPEMPFLGLTVWVLAGMINIVGGLLLMGSE